VGYDAYLIEGMQAKKYTSIKIFYLY